MSTNRTSRSLLAVLCLLSQGTFVRAGQVAPAAPAPGGSQPICRTGATSPRLSDADLTRLGAYVQRMMKDYGVPGVGLAVVQNGAVRALRGYGVRDVNTRAPVTADTQFSIGSVTKSFTALGMMVLVGRGLVKLNAPVITYLPEFRLSGPAATRTVTVRNLLSHSSGLVRTDATLFNPELTVKDVLAALPTTPLAGKPGKTFVYSNVNTILAGEIIHRVSGQPWAEFTREQVLRPLGMTKTTLSIPDLQRQPDIAAPHVLNIRDGGFKTTAHLTLGADAPAGAVNTSVTDLARYVQFQLGDGSPLLSKANLEAMHTGQVDAPEFNLTGVFADQARKIAKSAAVPGALVSNEQYGFYWGAERFLGQPLVQHGGNVTGETANITLLPKQRSGVVVLANVEGANTFMEVVRLHVAEVLLGCRGPDTSAVVQAQLRVLGQDNARTSADQRAARTYQPRAGELRAVAGSYKGLADAKPTRITVVDRRTLRLNSGFQNVRFAVDLLPMGNNRFMATSKPLIGGVIKVADKNGKRTIELEGLAGNIPLAASGK